jgi:AAA domain
MAEYPPEEWLVEQILPAGEFHVIGGPSGGGKTTLIMQLVTDWTAGRPVFGYSSYPRPFVYVSLDRGEKSLRRTLRRCGIDPDTFPYVCPLSTTKPVLGFQDLVEHFIKPRFPEVIAAGGVIIIEGVTTLMPGAGKANDYTATFKFFSYLSAFCSETGISIIGVMHSPKMRESERYLNPRQRLMHSVAIGAIAETIILSEPSFESPIKLDRIVTVLPRNAPEQEFRMRLDENGMHQPATEPEIVKAMGEDAQASELLDLWLTPKPVGYEFKSGELVDEMKLLGVSRRTVFNWLPQAEADGRIESIKHGYWRKLAPKPLDR